MRRRAVGDVCVQTSGNFPFCFYSLFAQSPNCYWLKAKSFLLLVWYHATPPIFRSPYNHTILASRPLFAIGPFIIYCHKLSHSPTVQNPWSLCLTSSPFLSQDIMLPPCPLWLGRQSGKIPLLPPPSLCQGHSTLSSQHVLRAPG